MDFAHVEETAICPEPLRTGIIDAVESLPHVYLKPIHQVMEEEVARAYKIHLRVNSMPLPDARGPIFPDRRDFSFRHMVPWVRMNTNLGEDIRRSRQRFQDEVVPETRSKRAKLGVGSAALPSVRFEIEQIRGSLFNSFRVGGVGLTEAGITVRDIAEFKRFANSVDLKELPYFSSYTVLNGYEYADPGRMDTKGDLCDAEHAIHAIWAHSVFVTENHVAQVLRNIMKNAELVGLPSGFLTVLTLREFKERLSAAEVSASIPP